MPELTYRAFGIKVGESWLDFPEFLKVCEELDIPTVPVLYRGPYSKEALLEYTDGKETVSGKASHIREGIVVYPITERGDRRIGRVVLKSVSGDYLTRKNKDATEFQ
jgi:RNA ligase (TIGR02306 family)